MATRPCEVDPSRGTPSVLRTPVQIEELWEHYGELHALSRRIVGDDATADDVVQDAYVRALRHLHRLDPGQSVRAWLATVVRRCSIDELRRQGRAAIPVDTMPETPAAPPGELLDALVARETLERLRQALVLLKPRERQILLRRVAEERSMAELAEADGSTVRAVESVLLRARAKLATALESEVVAAGAAR